MSPFNFWFLFLSVFTVIGITADNTYSQDLRADRRIQLPCRGCPNKLEISGLEIYGNFLFVLPQLENRLYIYQLDELLNSEHPSSYQIPFDFKKIPTDSEGWEALVIRKVSADSLVIYLGLEKCKKNKFCVFSAPLTVQHDSEGHITTFEIGKLQLFGKKISGFKNLSYEAMAWLDNPELRVKGLMLIPENFSAKNMHPQIITETGRHLRLETEGDFSRFRISDLTALPHSDNKYLAVSFCWKGKNGTLKDGNTWCYKKDDIWQSKLSFITFRLSLDENLKIQLLKNKRFDNEFISITGPDPNIVHEYNAEGLAVSDKGRIIIINDNYPDGAYTELRILSNNTIDD